MRLLIELITNPFSISDFRTQYDRGLSGSDRALVSEVLLPIQRSRLQFPILTITQFAECQYNRLLKVKGLAKIAFYYMIIKHVVFCNPIARAKCALVRYFSP